MEFRRCSSDLGRFAAEYGCRFDLNEQVGAAENGLDAGRSRQRIEFLLLIESAPLFVEGLVIALDVSEIASRAHNVMPRRAFGSEQRGDVIERATRLGAKVAHVHCSALIIDRKSGV